MIKVMIADDQELIRQSLQIVLSTHEDLKIVDAVENGFAVLESIKKERPDVILMDIRMPEMDGVYCTKTVKEKYPDIKIIILTTFDDDEFVFSALKYGASGYLLKGVSMDELYHAICTVYNGGAMINPDIATKVFKLFSKMSMSNYAIQVDDSLSKDLTQAELKVIQQVGFGLSNKEIAQRYPFEWQLKENIVYCDYLEHLLLHVLICKYPSDDKSSCIYAGIGGVVDFIVPELNDLYSGWITNQAWRKNCHNRVLADKEVYLSILRQFIDIEETTQNFDIDILCHSFNQRYGLWSDRKNKKLYAEIRALSIKKEKSLLKRFLNFLVRTF